MKSTLSIALLLASAAHAHVTLVQPSAPVGSSYRAAFKIAHGCDGHATREVSVTLPDGLRGAKPSPKPGWTLTTSRRALKVPYDSHGKAVTEELAEVRWVANSAADAVQDDWVDEFVLWTTLPADPGELWFAVHQRCSQGEWHWAERPSADTPRPRAPAVKLVVHPATLPATPTSTAHAH